MKNLCYKMKWGGKNKKEPSSSNINCAKQSLINIGKNHTWLSSVPYSITWPLQTLEDLTRSVSFTVSPQLPATISSKWPSVSLVMQTVIAIELRSGSLVHKNISKKHLGLQTGGKQLWPLSNREFHILGMHR